MCNVKAQSRAQPQVGAQTLLLPPTAGWAWVWRRGGALALSWRPESRAGRCSRQYLKREGSGAPGSQASPPPEIQGLFLLIE